MNIHYLIKISFVISLFPRLTLNRLLILIITNDLEIAIIRMLSSNLLVNKAKDLILICHFSLLSAASIILKIKGTVQ